MTINARIMALKEERNGVIHRLKAFYPKRPSIQKMKRYARI